MVGQSELYRLAPAPERIAALERARRKLYEQIRDHARALKAELDRLAAAGTTVAEAKGRLFTGGDALTAATNTLESAVLLVRVANWRFLATFDPNGPATFAKNVEKAEAGLKVFQEAEGAAAFTPRIQAVAETLGAYGRDFRATVSVLDLLKTVFETGIKPLTSQIEEAGTAPRAT
ncbi:hypothetical protein [Methylobacterium sp. GC_Met_2]|uniref:hypothetical protein n=1 Tax=Methylobacterium sp. GC_Met_2 TaxID=2937376 RepID=UPI00226BA267|nr:hypothetical protein [Methylobacterium sp. GC_Met_2]